MRSMRSARAVGGESAGAGSAVGVSGVTGVAGVRGGVVSVVRSPKGSKKPYQVFSSTWRAWGGHERGNRDAQKRPSAYCRW